MRQPGARVLWGVPGPPGETVLQAGCRGRASIPPMYYEIEAVRWDDGGHISHVRWHTVRLDGERIVRGESTVAPVVDAAEVCRSHEVRVFVDGGPGRFFRMKACDEGIDAEVDEQGTPLRERMAHLPSF